MKKLTILLITVLIIYVIYNVLSIRRINYISIHDNVLGSYNNHIKNYLLIKNKLDGFNSEFNNSSIIKIYQDIRNNRIIRINNQDYYLKKELRESDILVISVGMEEIISNFNKYDMKTNYSYFNNMYSNIEKLISEIKKYTYGKIIFLGYYNPTNYYDSHIDRFFYDIDIKLNRLMMDNDVIYIDLYELIKENNYKEKDMVILNNDGIKKLASIIEFYLE